MMSENQRKQMEEARKHAIETTMNVCATGEKRKYEEYDNAGNEINNE